MANSRVCSIPDCDKPHEARGWCKAHYMRWVRYGSVDDPKGTRRGAPKEFLRKIVLTYEGDDCLLWPFNRDTRGYGRIFVDGKKRSVNRLICDEEYGPAPHAGYHAAHSCGNGHNGCCTKRHLSWKSPSENNSDKAIHGTQTRGAKNGIAKLSEGDVREIRALKEKGMTQRQIAKLFGISQSNVSMIQNGAAWGWFR